MITDEDLASITPQPKQMLLRRIKDVYYLNNLSILIKLDEGQLKVVLSFIDDYLNYLIQLHMPKIWDEQDMQAYINQWMANN